MARRRLQAILATTVITTGLSAAPAMALPGVEEVTEPLEEVEETVGPVVEQVASTTTEVVEPVEETVEPVIGTVVEQPAAEEEDPPPPPIEGGTGDGTLDVSADVDLAESDADGSPELEVEASVTVLGTTLEVGDATDPIEDVVDPDEPTDPQSDGDTSSDGPVVQTPRIDGPGGLLAGGGLEPSGGDARGLQDPGGRVAGAPAATPAVFRPGRGVGAGQVGGDAGTTVPDVATDGADTSTGGIEGPAVMASDGPGAADTSESSALLRLLATAMVLGTAGIWFRATRQPGGGVRIR